MKIKIKTFAGFGNQKIFLFLKKIEFNLIYTNINYIKSISEHLKAKAYWIIASHNDEIIGLFPYLVKSGPFGCVFNSMPYYGSNGGIINKKNNKVVKNILYEKFLSNAIDNDAISATIITNPLKNDYLFYDELNNYSHKDERISLVTKLFPNDNEETIIKRYSNPRPRNIRKAINEGIVIKKYNSMQAIKILYQMHFDNMVHNGGLPKELEFFKLIKKYFSKKQWKIYIAYKDQTPVASLLLLFNNVTVEYFTPAIVNSFRKYQPLSLIIFNAMVEASQNGYCFWNWGGTLKGMDGVYNFKKKWASTEGKYYYYNYVFKKSIYKLKADLILNNYKGFYVLPFSKLSV